MPITKSRFLRLDSPNVLYSSDGVMWEVLSNIKSRKGHTEVPGTREVTIRSSVDGSVETLGWGNSRITDAKGCPRDEFNHPGAEVLAF